MLQSIVFVSVDIFLQKLHNEGINSKLDAWLTFLGCDEPEYLILLITKYPYFKTMYADLYELCLNTERMMNMYSKELAILDRNTVKYMIDELQEKIDEKDAALAEKDATIAELQAKLKEFEENARK